MIEKKTTEQVLNLDLNFYCPKCRKSSVPMIKQTALIRNKKKKGNLYDLKNKVWVSLDEIKKVFDEHREIINQLERDKKLSFKQADACLNQLIVLEQVVGV